jgi:hypothetical protein
MFSIGLKTDVSEFNEALRQYADAYKNKDIPDIINQAAVDVCFKAAAKTRGAKVSSINKFAPNKKGYPGRLFYALQNSAKISNTTKVRTGIGRSRKDRKFTGSRSDRAWALYNKRIASIKYIATGWIGAAQKLGAKTRVQPSSNLLRDCRGEKATRLKFYADLTNGAIQSGALSFAKDALETALREVAAKKKERALARLEKLNAKHSAK